jgi:hypothetical protein
VSELKLGRYPNYHSQRQLLTRSRTSNSALLVFGDVCTAEKADVEINAKGRLGRGSDRSAEVLRVDIAFAPLLDAQRSALSTLALPDDRCGRCVFDPDTYRFCKLISDTIKTTVDIGCGSGAGGMRFIPHEPCRALRAAGWVANAARFPVPFGRTALQQADSVVEGHALN